MSDVGGFAKFAQDEFYYPSGSPPTATAAAAGASSSDPSASASATLASSEPLAVAAAAAASDVDADTAEYRTLAHVTDHYISLFSAVGSTRRKKKSGGLHSDGPPKKRGRPKKEYAPGEEPSPRKKRKAKRGEDGETEAENSKKSPRKRVKKEKDAEAETAGDAAPAPAGDDDVVVEPTTPKPKKKIGRPRKNPLLLPEEGPDAGEGVAVVDDDAAVAGPSTPKTTKPKPKRTPRAKATPKGKSSAAAPDPEAEPAAEGTDSPRTGVRFEEVASTSFEQSSMPESSTSGAIAAAASTSASASAASAPAISSTTATPPATPKRKRGRPSLKDLVARAEAAATAATAETQVQPDIAPIPAQTNDGDVSMAGEDMSVVPKEPDVIETAPSDPPKKKRGRPRKTNPISADADGQPAAKRRKITKAAASRSSKSTAPTLADVPDSTDGAAPAPGVEADEAIDVDATVSPSVAPVPPEAPSEASNPVASTSRSSPRISPGKASASAVRPRLSKKASSSPKTSILRPNARSRAKVLAPAPIAVTFQTPSTPYRPQLASPLSRQPSNANLLDQASTSAIDSTTLTPSHEENSDIAVRLRLLWRCVLVVMLIVRSVKISSCTFRFQKRSRSNPTWPSV